MTVNLRKAISKNKLESFIEEREPLEAPKASVARYINASASPLESSKASRSKSDAGRFSDYK